MLQSTKSIVNCDKCNEPFEATALLLGTTPGFTCKCGWGTMTRSDFKAMFGFSFSRFKRELDRQPKTYFEMHSHTSGNSADRRRERRKSIRLLKAARATAVEMEPLS